MQPDHFFMDDIAKFLSGVSRTASLQRTTKETDIHIE